MRGYRGTDDVGTDAAAGDVVVLDHFCCLGGRIGGSGGPSGDVMSVGCSVGWSGGEVGGTGCR